MHFDVHAANRIFSKMYYRTNPPLKMSFRNSYLKEMSRRYSDFQKRSLPLFLQITFFMHKISYPVNGLEVELLILIIMITVEIFNALLKKICMK